MIRHEAYNEFDEDADFDESAANPFAASWPTRLIGKLLWLIDAVRYWGSWPFRAMSHTFRKVMGRVLWTASRMMDRLREGWYRLSFRAWDFFKVDDLRKSVHSLQDTTTQSVGHLTEDVATRLSWIALLRRPLDRLGQAVSWLLLVWFEFLEKARHSPVLGVVTTPLRWSSYLARDVADFAIGWILTRHYRHLLFGIPAFLMMMPLAYCAVRLPFHTSAVKAKHYRRAAAVAIENEDRQAAELYFRKLTQLGHVHERVTFRTALLAASQDSIDEAYEKMQQIASLNNKGNELAEAHVWIAHHIQQGEIEQDNPRRDELRVAHLRRAVKLMPEWTAVQSMLASALADQQQYQQAVDLIDSLPAAELTDQHMARLAEWNIRLGNAQRSAQLASRLEMSIRQRHQDGEELTGAEYLQWAAAAEMTGDYNEAAGVLLEAIRVHPDSEEVRTTAAEVCLPYVDTLPLKTTEDAQQVIQLLELFVTISDDPEPGLTRLAHLTMAPITAKAAKEALAQYERQHGDLPGRTLKILGDIQVKRGQIATAQSFYRRAIEATPDNHVALNNLAYLTAHNEPIDLEEALAMADRAVSLMPDNPHYLETRGQILTKLKRWEDAVADLSVALNGMPTKLEIHESLGIAYAALGEPELAQFHKARAE